MDLQGMNSAVRPQDRCLQSSSAVVTPVSMAGAV